MKYRLPAVLTAGVMLSSPALASITIDSFSAATNDRFANNASFVADAYDLSGVGRAFTGNGGNRGGHWATMIAPNIFITAQHYHASTGTDIYFYPDNDPGSTPVVRTVAGGQQIGGTDLWVGYFDFAVPSTIAIYPFATADVTELNFSFTIADDEAFLLGATPSTGGYASQRVTNTAVGQNRMEGFSEDQTVSGSASVGDTIFTIRNQSGDLGYTYETYESDLNAGDSGSPLFNISGGFLQVAGIGWASGTIDIDPLPTEALRDVSIFTYTGSYDSAIQSYIDANLVTIVPEPSLVSLLALGSLAGLRRRRH